MAEIYLSPAVLRYDRGICGFGTVEQRMSLIADVVEYELSRSLISTQRSAPDMTIQEVCAVSNAYLPKAHVALTSFSAVGEVSGCIVYHRDKNGNGERLASEIALHIGGLTGVVIADAKSAFGGLGFYELSHILAPSVLIMAGYQDCKMDALFITEHSYELGRAIAAGCASYLGKSIRDFDKAAAKRFNGVYL